MFNEPDNTDRAGWARKALNVFAKETFSRSFDKLITDDNGVTGDAHDSMKDLITDLLHLAHQLGWNPKTVISCAVGNFEEELAEEEDEDEDDG